MKLRPRQISCAGIRSHTESGYGLYVSGMVTMGGNGDAETHNGCAIHLYVANSSMTDRFFYNADGEMLIVAQKGRHIFKTGWVF